MLFIDWICVFICHFFSSHFFFRSQQNYRYLIFLQQKNRNKTKQMNRSKRNKPDIQAHTSSRKKKISSTHPLFKATSPPLFHRDQTACFFRWPIFFVFSSLLLICRKTVFDEANDVEFWLSGCVPITSSLRKKVVSPKGELPSTSKQPSTVVRSISQFERHCPGASRLMPADDDSSSPSSGSILPSIHSSIQTRTSYDIPEQRDRRLESWAVPIGATIVYPAARPLFSMMRLSMASCSSVKLAARCSRSFKKLLTLCSDFSFSDGQISFFNAFTYAHILGVVSSGVGVVDCETTTYRIHRTDRKHEFSSRLQAFLLRGDVSIP